MVPAIGLALIASLAISGLVAGTASATTQRWYSCHEFGESAGGYTDSGCQKQGVGKFDWNETGSSTPLSMSTGYVLIKGKVVTWNLAISCWNGSATGAMKNPAGGGSGTLSTEAPLALTECFVEEPELSCKVKEEKITFNQVNGTATEFEGKPAVQISPASGEVLASITLQNCTKKGYLGTYPLSGSLYGNMNAATSTLEFSEAGSKVGGYLAGNPVRFDSWMKITGGGENVRLNIDPPSNIVLPSMSRERPQVGEYEFASPGNWSNKPTSYQYQWRRCDYLGGHCADIAGQTSSAYKPVTADIGQRLVMQVKATNAGGSTQASSLPTKVVGGNDGQVYWYACSSAGSGALYGDSACFEQVSGGGSGYSLSKLGSTPTTLAQTVVSPFVLNWSTGGVAVVTTCNGISGSGSVVNPGTGSGTIDDNSPSLSSCSISTPSSMTSKCVVAPIRLELGGTPAEVGGKIQLTDYTNTYMNISGAGCTLGANWWVHGEVTGVFDNTTNTLGFSKSGTEGLAVATVPATLEGSSRLETTGGARLRVAP